MSAYINAANSKVPPATLEVSSANSTVGRVAADLKYSSNVSTQLSSPQYKHDGGSPLKRVGAFRRKERPNFDGKPGGLVAATVKHCHNAQVQPSSSVHKHKFGVLNAIKDFLGLKSGGASSKKTNFDFFVVASAPVTDVKREEIKQSVRDGLRRIDLEGKVRGDKDFRDQIFASNCCAIFRGALGRVERECDRREVSPEFRVECLKELGGVARHFKMEGEEKNGVYTPAHVGANGLVTAVSSLVVKAFPLELSDISLRGEIIQYTEGLVGEKLRDLALEHKMPDPQELFQALLHVEVMRFPDYA